MPFVLGALVAFLGIAGSCALVAVSVEPPVHNPLVDGFFLAAGIFVGLFGITSSIGVGIWLATQF